MKLVKEVSLEEAKQNVQMAVMNISDASERNEMLVALMQLQDALNREKQEKSEEMYTVTRIEHGDVVESNVVSRAELESFVYGMYNVSINGKATVNHIEMHNAFVTECIDKGVYFDLRIEPFYGE